MIVKQGKDEFYTLKSIENLITEMVQSYEVLIYCTAFSSGEMFLQSIKYIEQKSWK